MKKKVGEAGMAANVHGPPFELQHSSFVLRSQVYSIVAILICSPSEGCPPPSSPKLFLVYQEKCTSIHGFPRQ